VRLWVVGVRVWCGFEGASGGSMREISTASVTDEPTTAKLVQKTWREVGSSASSQV